MIGVSRYSAGISDLPAVTHDLREIANLLGSSSGAFSGSDIAVLGDADATRAAVDQALHEAFEGATASDTVFVYIAGHGSLGSAGEYYFIPHDARVVDLPGSAIPLTRIKSMFDNCRSERVLMWLDFCHSGGILARNAVGQDVDSATATVKRTLRVTEGHGKVMMCACSADQSAFESAGHGHFTRYLLRGLKGDAVNRAGEVTAGSLHDYIDHEMGSAQQRPMFSGEMAGRIVLMHSRAAGVGPGKAASDPVMTDDVVVNDSGTWVLLKDHLFQSSRVREGADGQISVHIPSTSAADDAKIRGLKPERSWGSSPIAFAHRNDGFLARVTGIESESTNAGAEWVVALTAEVEHRGGFGQDIGLQENGRNYSADQIAELRGRRLLLNENPVKRSSRRAHGSGMLDYFIQGQGSAFPVTACVFHQYASALRNDTRAAMQMARLVAIYGLKASHVFERILELKLGPLRDGKLHVRCRGQRPNQFTNEQPVVVEIEGECLLP